MSTGDESIRNVVIELTNSVAELRAQRNRIDEQIARQEGALAALGGQLPGRRHGGSTARVAVKAALASYKQPVHTTTLLDNELLNNYSRHTLRSALGELHRLGEIKAVERTPKGYIWAPTLDSGTDSKS